MNKEDSKKDFAMIAVVRIRGSINVTQKIKTAFDLLRLYNKNYCVVLKGAPTVMGMINKIKDYVTWGEINSETYKLLVEKRGKEYKGREKDSKGKITYSNFIVVDGKKYKPFFRLNPPRKGYGRKGIKIAFKVGGALGYRGEKINDLLKRMI